MAINWNTFMLGLDEEDKRALELEIIRWRSKQNDREAARLVLDDEEVRLIENGEKINAIMHLRNRIGCRLFVAKRAIEQWHEKMAGL